MTSYLTPLVEKNWQNKHLLTKKWNFGGLFGQKTQTQKCPLWGKNGLFSGGNLRSNKVMKLFLSIKLHNISWG